MTESPDASLTVRAWIAVALTAPLFALLFLPSLLLVEVFPASGDGWAELAYAALGLFAYAAGVLVVLPVVAHTVGRFVDARTRDTSTVKAGVVFGVLAGALGSVIAVPMTLDGQVGVTPLVSYVAAPALAAFLTRVLLPVAVRYRGVRITAIVVAALVAAPTVAFVVTMGPDMLA